MSTSERSAFAILTPPGRGGIAVLRCVGPGAVGALKACFRPASAKAGAPSDSPGGMPPPGHLAYGHVVDANGRALDEIILCRLATHESASQSTATQRRVTVPPAPAAADPAAPEPAAAEPAAAPEPAAGAAGDSISWPIFEVNCHGGPAAVAAVAHRLAELGLEQVDADRLLEIEGVPWIEREARRLLRAARTPLAARILLDQLHGALGRALAKIGEDLMSGGLAAARESLDALLSRWRHAGRFLADPPRIVIAGRPNVGKSTLLNRLVGADRAITSPAPGTTRDYVEADAALDGVPVVLVDTAGLREGRDAVERLGVERARRELARASLVLYLLDAVEGPCAEDQATLRALGPRALAVWNKVDLSPAESGAVGVSALLGDGVTELTAVLLARLGYQPPASGDAVPFTLEQASVLEEARKLLAAGKPDAARRVLSP
jgi:tRNA modification GTPase